MRKQTSLKTKQKKGYELEAKLEPRKYLLIPTQELLLVHLPAICQISYMSGISVEHSLLSLCQKKSGGEEGGGSKKQWRLWLRESELHQVESVSPFLKLWHNLLQRAPTEDNSGRLLSTNF